MGGITVPQLNPPQMGEGPLDQYAKLMSMKGMMQNQELRTKQIELANQEMVDQKVYYETMAGKSVV